MSEQRRPRVLISDPIADNGVELLRQHFQVDEKFNLSQEELQERISNYDAIIVRSGTRVDSRIIEAGTRLRVVARAGSGLDNIDVTTARTMGVEVRNCPGANSISVAEHTFALILALARHIPKADANLKAGRWQKKQLRGYSLDGKALGIIGFGRIGRQVAKRAHGFNMRVLVNQPRLTPELALEAGVTPRDLPELLHESDIVTVHVPMRPENVGLISENELAQMKPSAFLINTSRGGIVDEDALLHALENDVIAGAGVDVYEEEPATDNPLAKHDKVVATPHIAASTFEAQRNVALAIAEQVVDVLGTQGEVAETLSLQLVPTDNIVPHEETDPARVEKLAEAIEADDKLVNPPVVAQWQGQYIVLDGATRTGAFKRLQIPHIIVQVVDPDRSDVDLHTWYHVVSDISPEVLLQSLNTIDGLALNEVSPADAQNLLRERDALAYLRLRDERAYLAELVDGNYNRLDVLNAMVESYTLQGDVARTLTTDLHNLKTTYPNMAALVIFPQFTPNRVLEVAAKGQTLPQGITRFIVPGRVLRLNAPLEPLKRDEPLSAKRRWLDEYVRDKLSRRSVRYYQEPVVILED